MTVHHLCHFVFVKATDKQISPALSSRSTLFQADMADPEPSFFNAWEESCVQLGGSLADSEKAECDL